MSMLSSGRTWVSTLAASLVTGLVAALAVPALAAAPAAAATTATPVNPALATAPATVSADVLPTVQVDGVVWAQVVVGNTAYATGKFANARPAGAAAGTNQTARSNVLAFDVTTGNLITSWAPSLNGQGLAITASPDGSRIYVAGEFTSASGVAKSRLVALDARTGAVVSSFKANPNSRVRALAAAGSTVYAGGAFTAANGQARSGLAAFSAADGSLLPWAPSADAEPYAMVAPTAKGELVVAGRFSSLNGQTALGSGALDLTTGAVLPWAASSVANDWGPKAAIYSLSTDGDAVYATGYNFSGTGNLESAFAADAAGGAIRWVSGCSGDTYGSAPLNGVLYTVSHAHNCSPIGGHPQTDPWTFQRTLAFPTAWQGNTNRGGNFDGQPAPSILPWLPTLSAGSYTGQSQAAWSVAGNSSYVVEGGEFPKVNGTAQQGLVRFAVRSLAPNKDALQGYPELAAKAVGLQPGTVRVSVQSAWDSDDRTLTYDLLRGTGTGTVVATTTGNSSWWDRPTVALKDTSAPRGTTQTYRVRVTDPYGNTLTGASTTTTVPADATTDTYRDAVLADGAAHYWRLDEPSGTTAYDWSGSDDLTVDASATRGTAGALPSGDTATGLGGAAAVPAVGLNREVGPDTFSAEAWVRTGTTSGGKIIGFGDSTTGASSNYDRQVYMRNDGRLVFGVNGNGLHHPTSSKAYNDDRWHHVVATLGSDGAVLYVDGVRAARDATAVGGQPFSGFWRVGGDNLNGWPDQPSSGALAGTVDDVAIYPTALSATTVQAHYSASGRTAAVPTRPGDPYGAAVWDDHPDSWWRLEDTTGAVAADSSPNGVDGDLVNGPTLGAQGIQGGHGASLDGGDDTIVSTSQIPAPTQYSLEMWFSTTTTRGGKLIGFGDDPSGYSGNYDRHVWMTDDGHVVFGTWTGQANTATSAKPYNDGAWHQLVATQGPAGMVLYADGVAVATNAQTAAQGGYSGYWRVGGDHVWYGASSDWIAGTVDEVATYSSVLPATAVAGHFAAAGGNLAPTAAFTTTAPDLTASFDATSSTDDGRIASYAWDFGDGATGSGATRAHTYGARGTYQVTLTVTDDRGATGTVTHPVTVRTAAPAAPTDAYGAAVVASGADSYWRLEESGTTAADSGHGDTPGTLQGGAALGAAGVLGGHGVALDGSDDTLVSSAAVTNPQQYSLELWFDTTTTRGGRLIGFGDNPSGYSSNYDRQVWMTDDGRLSFGTWTGQANVTSSTASYDDGHWHHLVATQGPVGLVLHVDGHVVGSDPQTGAQPYTGYWKVGGDNTWGGSSSSHFAGIVDEVAIYTSQLDDATVADHFAKGSAAVATDQAPTAAFTSVVKDLSATFDASASADADGSVRAWSWDFGDGSTGTGATTQHAYTAAGTHAVTLTVTDDAGATGSVTHEVTTSAAVPTNQAPTAAFTSMVKDLSASFDASASADADGSVKAYAWDFGDRATGTGATAQHTYTAAGTYTVVLTVTDDGGATGSIPHDVVVTAPVPANSAPTAAFTTSVKDLGVALDASGSKDADGSVKAWAWDFGDGVAGTGATASHTYAAAGSYQVTLTVTDDAGATGTATQPVTVTAPVPPASTTLAKDSFTRTVTGGLGAADAGGAWTLTGAASGYSVSGGAGHVAVAKAGTTSAAYLGSVSSADTDVRATFSLDKSATGGGAYLSLLGRRVGADDYRAKVRVAADGTASVTAEKVVAGVETSFKAVTVAGLRVSAAQQLTVRLQVVGTAPTTLNAKVWAAGTAEPASWAVTATDTTTGLQAAGGLGVLAYLSGSATNAPVTVDVRDLVATTSGAAAPAPAPANSAPTAAFTSTVKDLSASFDASASADADGSVRAWSWDFGDGSTGTGATAQHAYTAAGTYSVALKVTDDAGATGTATHPVTVTAPAAPPAPAPPATGGTLAQDAFTRTVTGGLGTADAGGAWTVATGSASSFSVDGQAASITLPRAGANVAGVLPGVASTSVDLTTTLRADQAGTGGGTYLYAIARRTSAGDYRARVRLLADGRVALAITRWTSTGEAVLGGESVVTGLTGAPGTVLRLRVQATGTAPTALRARVWVDGAPEPTAWQKEVTDTTAGFQAAGSIGLAAYLSSTSTSVPTVLHVDDLLAVTPQAP